MKKFSCWCKRNQSVVGVNAYPERDIDVYAETKEEAKDICMHLLEVESVIYVESWEESDARYKPDGALHDYLA